MLYLAYMRYYTSFTDYASLELVCGSLRLGLDHGRTQTVVVPHIGPLSNWQIELPTLYVSCPGISVAKAPLPVIRRETDPVDTSGIVVSNLLISSVFVELRRIGLNVRITCPAEVG